MSRGTLCAVAGIQLALWPGAALAQDPSGPPTGALPDVEAPPPRSEPENPAAPPAVTAVPESSPGFSAAPAATGNTGAGQVPLAYGTPTPGPPPPPPRKPDTGFELPTFSVRIDPFNWLLDGRLGIELEAEVLRFLSVELVPMFVVSEQPPFIGRAFDELVTQHSNGIGALAGTSLGVGFWFSRKALHGTVLRAIFTNYGLSYRSLDADGETYDELSHTERHLYGYLGSHTVMGGFTIAGGVGLGVELNRERRCFEGPGTTNPTSDCPKDELQLARGATTVWDMNSWTHPVQILGRISLGVTF